MSPRMIQVEHFRAGDVSVWIHDANEYVVTSGIQHQAPMFFDSKDRADVFAFCLQYNASIGNGDHYSVMLQVAREEWAAGEYGYANELRQRAFERVNAYDMLAAMNGEYRFVGQTFSEDIAEEDIVSNLDGGKVR